MARGDAAALNYQIPQTFIGGQQVQQPPSSIEPQNPIQNPAQLLAHREGLTRQYYDLNGKLDAYVTSMAKDNGIDVTKPDFTQPGGGEAFNTFQQLSSALLYTANDLARSAKIDDAILQQSAQGNIRMQAGYDPKTQLSSQMSPEEMFYSTKLDPQVSQINDFLNKDFYTQRDADVANQQGAQLRAYYDDLINNDPQNRAMYEAQKAAIGTATRKTPYSAFQQRGGSGQGGTSGLGVLKKITNLTKGVWTPGTYKPVTKAGKAYIENTEMAGDSMGQYISYKDGQAVYKPKIVRRWLKDPDTGDVFVEFQDSSLPLENVSNQPGSSTTATFMSNNPKYGDSAKMIEKASEIGLLDDTNTSIDELLMPENYKDIQTQIRQSAQPQAQAVAKEVEKVKSLLSTPEHHWYSPNTVVPFTLPQGTIKVEKTGDDEYEISNYKTFLGGKKSDYEGLSEEAVLNILSELGYFDQFVSTPKEAATPTADKPKTVVQNGHTYTWNDSTQQYE
jgi:hypothetical protein